MVAVGAWSVPWGLYGRREGVAVPLGPMWPVSWIQYGRRGGMARQMGPVWPPWERGHSPRCFLAAVGAWPVFWARMAAVWTWLVPLTPYGRRGGAVVTLSHVRLLWGRGRSPGTRMVAVGVCPVP